ncbi:hypothetical protein OG799_10610 [Micromonospora sp. NBC_00898]|uniref:hypothetical protein n=1 Tax=Micromonospora sp. NBC_00898 TaxID=2975981 RepID=UPI00386F78B0|nr:hypothetical protein OG799_10610 [Micromonospora sp. NBC_00898]
MFTTGVRLLLDPDANMTVLLTRYPLTTAVRRLGGRRGAPLVRRSARWLAATGLATTMGLIVYVFFMMATAANIAGPVLIGRPIPWLVLQVLAAATIIATAATALSWLRHHRDLTHAHRARLVLLIAAGLLFLPWAVYWGLLIP